MRRYPVRVLLPSWLIILMASATLAIDPPPGQFPTAIRKMSPHADQKFLDHYAAFAPDTTSSSSGSDVTAEGNTTGLAPPFRPLHLHLRPRNLLFLGSRDACPAGMSGCSAAGAPSKCCPDGSYCAAVSDQTAGGIACCPDGASCLGEVAACPADAVSCPSELGGGCCIPGFVCFGVGCKFVWVPACAAPFLTNMLIRRTCRRAEPAL